MICLKGKHQWGVYVNAIMSLWLYTARLLFLSNAELFAYKERLIRWVKTHVVQSLYYSVLCLKSVPKLRCDAGTSELRSWVQYAPIRQQLHLSSQYHTCIIRHRVQSKWGVLGRAMPLLFLSQGAPWHFILRCTQRFVFEVLRNWVLLSLTCIFKQI